MKGTAIALLLKTRRILTPLALITLLASEASSQQLYINEIFFNPGGGANDLRDEFIEIRGETPGMSLADHYLIILENELDEFGVGEAGIIENVFDLGIADDGGAATLGSNGFLVLRQKFNRYSGAQVFADATQLVNDGPNKPGGGTGAFPGFGNLDAEGSTIGQRDIDSGDQAPTTGALENSGFTAMLIHVDTSAGTAPVLGDDLDDGNDGLDVSTGQIGWTILDSVGMTGEADETEFGRLYAQVNYLSGDPSFFPPGFEPNLEPNAVFEYVNFEVEHLARWGNSTGQRVEDWHITNLTNNSGSGASGTNGNTGPVDLRQSFVGNHDNLASGDPTVPPTQPPVNQLESNKGVPYGTPLLTNIGGPNFISGDYNGDGVVDAADFTVYRDTEGGTATETSPQPADADRSFVVDAADLGIWGTNYGAPNGAPPAPSAAIPEPSATLLAVVAYGLLSMRRPTV